MRKFRLLCSQLIFLAAFCGLLSPSWQVPPRGGVIYLDYHGRDGRLATASYLVTRDGFFRMFGGTYQAATEQERIAITNDDDTDTDGDGYAGDVKLLVMLERMSCEAETRADSHLWLEDGRGRGRQMFCNNLVGGKVTISEGDTGVAVGVSEGWGGGSGVDATGKANLATLRVAAYYSKRLPAFGDSRSAPVYKCVRIFLSRAKIARLQLLQLLGFLLQTLRRGGDGLLHEQRGHARVEERPLLPLRTP